jgi:hypothetical protein
MSAPKQINIPKPGTKIDSTKSIDKNERLISCRVIGEIRKGRIYMTQDEAWDLINELSAVGMAYNSGNK